MNEELKGVLLSYLKQLLGVIENASRLAVDQIPQIVAEKLAYDFWEATFWTLLSAAILILSVFSGRWGWKTLQEDPTGSDGGAPIIAFALVGLIFGTIVFCANSMIMLKIAVAPRLYIVEWLRTVVN